MATFFEKSSKLQTEDRKTELTLSLIHQIKLRLGGYSIWSASTSCTIYQDRFGACAPHSLHAAEEALERLHKALDGMFRALGTLEDIFRNTRCLQDSATKSSGACQARGSGTAHRRRMFYNKGWHVDYTLSPCNYLIGSRTSQIRKKLLDHTRIGLLSLYLAGISI